MCGDPQLSSVFEDLRTNDQPQIQNTSVRLLTFGVVTPYCFATYINRRPRPMFEGVYDQIFPQTIEAAGQLRSVHVATALLLNEDGFALRGLQGSLQKTGNRAR